MKRLVCSADASFLFSIESPMSADLFVSVSHSVFVKGDAGNFEIEASVGVKSSELYPEVKYTTLDELLDQFV
jgi:hypothetical protein